jgi:hypothetical protein
MIFICAGWVLAHVCTHVEKKLLALTLAAASRDSRGVAVAVLSS